MSYQSSLAQSFAQLALSSRDKWTFDLTTQIAQAIDEMIIAFEGRIAHLESSVQRAEPDTSSPPIATTPSVPKAQTSPPSTGTQDPQSIAPDAGTTSSTDTAPHE